MVRFAIILFALAGSLPVLAQPWEALQSLKRGDRIKILDTTGRERKGQFLTVSDQAITLQTGKSETSIERAKVRRVRVHATARRVRNVLIGVGIGAAAGIALDYTIGALLRNETGESGGARAVTYISPIALFGTIGALRPAYRTLYQLR